MYHSSAKNLRFETRYRTQFDRNQLALNFFRHRVELASDFNEYDLDWIYRKLSTFSRMTEITGWTLKLLLK